MKHFSVSLTLMINLFITLFLLSGCSTLPVLIGFIPGAPTYFSSMLDSGTCAYETAQDVRSTKQQMRDSLVEGHVRAEFIKDKEIDALEVSPYCYYGKLYLVGEYDGEEELQAIMHAVDKVPNKRRVIRRLYLKCDPESELAADNYLISTKIKTQLATDLDITSTPLRVEVIQRDVVLLGVVSDAREREKIIAQAGEIEGVRNVISFLKHPEALAPKAIKTELADSRPTKNTSGNDIVTVKKRTGTPRRLAEVRPDRGR